MRETTDALIDRLAREGKPVRPLAPPLVRAGLFVAIVAAAMAGFAAFSGDIAGTVSHLGDGPFAMELAGAVIAGVGAIAAALVMSVPGRSSAWLYLPVPGILLWFAGGGIECYANADAFGFATTPWLMFRACFVFIVTTSVPVAVGLYFVLRRAAVLHLLPVTALSGLGAAMLGAALLQFFHAHGTNAIDFATHIAAVATLMLLMSTVGRLALKRV